MLTLTIDFSLNCYLTSVFHGTEPSVGSWIYRNDPSLGDDNKWLGQHVFYIGIRGFLRGGRRIYDCERTTVESPRRESRFVGVSKAQQLNGYREILRIYRLTTSSVSEEQHPPVKIFCRMVCVHHIHSEMMMIVLAQLSRYNAQ